MLSRKEVKRILIQENGGLAEIITQEQMLESIKNNNLKSLWGTSIGKIIHLGYDKLIIKQQDLIRAGFKHQILIADVHTMLENPVLYNDAEQLKLRTEYTKAYFEHLCNLSRAKIVVGSSFQYDEEYIRSVYKIASVSPIHSVLDINGVHDSKIIGPDLYVMMQIADGEYLGRNFVYGGMNQRGIYVLGRKALELAGFNPPVILLSSIAKDILGKKLLHSSFSTRITIHDDKQTLQAKIKIMASPPVTKDNPLLECFKFSIIPWFKNVTITTRDGEKNLTEFFELEKLYTERKVTENKLKEDAFYYLSQRLEKMHKYFDEHPKLVEWIDFSRINH